MELGDMKKGDKITVLEWTPNHKGYQDQSWVGESLTVLAIQDPFVAVHDEKLGIRFRLDTRRVKLVPLNAEYAAALAGNDGDWPEEIDL